MIWLLLLACGGPKDITSVLALEGNAERGRAQYQIQCARCHGAEGGGIASTPALAGRVRDIRDPIVVSTMINGNGAMTAVRLEDQQASDILAFLRAEWP